MRNNWLKFFLLKKHVERVECLSGFQALWFQYKRQFHLACFRTSQDNPRQPRRECNVRSFPSSWLLPQLLSGPNRGLLNIFSTPKQSEPRACRLIFFSEVWGVVSQTIYLLRPQLVFFGRCPFAKQYKRPTSLSTIFKRPSLAFKILTLEEKKCLKV